MSSEPETIARARLEVPGSSRGWILKYKADRRPVALRAAGVRRARGALVGGDPLVAVFAIVPLTLLSVFVAPDQPSPPAPQHLPLRAAESRLRHRAGAADRRGAVCVGAPSQPRPSPQLPEPASARAARRVAWTRRDGTKMGRVEYTIDVLLRHQSEIFRVGLKHPKYLRRSAADEAPALRRAGHRALAESAEHHPDLPRAGLPDADPHDLGHLRAPRRLRHRRATSAPASTATTGSTTGCRATSACTPPITNGRESTGRCCRSSMRRSSTGSRRDRSSPASGSELPREQSARVRLEATHVVGRIGGAEDDGPVVGAGRRPWLPRTSVGSRGTTSNRCGSRAPSARDAAPGARLERAEQLARVEAGLAVDVHGAREVGRARSSSQ